MHIWEIGWGRRVVESPTPTLPPPPLESAQVPLLHPSWELAPARLLNHLLESAPVTFPSFTLSWLQPTSSTLRWSWLQPSSFTLRWSLLQPPTSSDFQSATQPECPFICLPYGRPVHFSYLCVAGSVLEPFIVVPDPDRDNIKQFSQKICNKSCLFNVRSSIDCL